MKRWSIVRGDPGIPQSVGSALDVIGESVLTGIGAPELMQAALTALFCSSRCPGSAILRALELAQTWRKLDTTVISGFHSPVEQETLKVLLDGASPIVICLARSLERYRVPGVWTAAIQRNRLLVLSPFRDRPRVTRELAERRNLFIAHLADRIEIVHADPGSKTEALRSRIEGAPRR